MYGNKNGETQKAYSPSNKKDPTFHYDSLKDAMSKISCHLIGQGEDLNNFPIIDYISKFKYLDGSEWKNLNDRFINSIP